MSGTTRTHKITLTDAEQFFYEHAPYSVRPGEDEISARIRSAAALARAEAIAKGRGATVAWEEDDLAWLTESWRACGDDHGQAWGAVLRDAEGTALGSLWGITFESHEPAGEPYARVVAAELADEYL
jgi:hypothetical protein